VRRREGADGRAQMVGHTPDKRLCQNKCEIL
jgi:hypothetical protein